MISSIGSHRLNFHSWGDSGTHRHQVIIMEDVSTFSFLSLLLFDVFDVVTGNNTTQVAHREEKRRLQRKSPPERYNKVGSRNPIRKEKIEGHHSQWMTRFSLHSIILSEMSLTKWQAGKERKGNTVSFLCLVVLLLLLVDRFSLSTKGRLFPLSPFRSRLEHVRTPLVVLFDRFDSRGEWTYRKWRAAGGIIEWRRRKSKRRNQADMFRSIDLSSFSVFCRFLLYLFTEVECYSLFLSPPPRQAILPLYLQPLLCNRHKRRRHHH